MKAKSLRTKSAFHFAIGIPALVWQILFFYLPLFFLLLSSFLALSETGVLNGITFQHIRQFLTPIYFKVILASLILAITTTSACFLIGYPLAYYIAFRGKKFKNFFLFFLIVPFWTNFLLHVYAWFYVLEREGFLNQILMALGITSSAIHFLNSPFAIMIMMVYYYLPFMVLPLYTSLEKFDHRLIEASLDLGASFTQTLLRIMLPLSRRGIRAGFFLVFIPSFGEFIIPELMGGDKKVFVGTVVSQYMLGEGTGSLGSAFTLIACLVAVVTAILFNQLIDRLLEPKVRNG